MTRRHRSDWVALIRGVGLSALVATSIHAQSPKESYLQRLAEREARIHDMSGRYETRSIATERYARRQIEIFNQAVAEKRRVGYVPATLEAAIEQSRTTTIYTYMLRNDGGLRERRLDHEVRRSDPASPFSSGRIAFDGSHSYEVRDAPVTLKKL